MRGWLVVELLALSLTASTDSGLAVHSVRLQEDHRTAQESPLHERAVKAGGNLHETREAAPDKLYPDLASLARASDGALLVHIIRNSCTVSPSGNDVVTMYKALVLKQWSRKFLTQGMEHGGGETVDFSVPGGLVGFNDKTQASVSIRGFKPLQDGGRYVLFLRFALGEERQLTPALRLTGQGVQGAFGLENEEVHPSYERDALGKKYLKARVPDFLGKIQLAIHDALGIAGSPPPRPPEPMTSLCLSPGHLQALGMHLPSYLPVVRGLIGYQLSLASAGSRKEWTIEWDSLPGLQGNGVGLVREQDVSNIPLSPNFLLVEPTQRHYAYGLSDDTVAPRMLVIVATTSDGEVRGTNIIGDPRSRGGEGLFMIAPKVTFNVVFPDDPQIARIVFLRPMSAEPPQMFRLEQIGKIELKPRSATNVQ